MNVGRAGDKRAASGRPHISLDFVVKNEGLVGGNSNGYVKSFCHDGDTLKRLYDLVETDSSILKLMNKQVLKKRSPNVIQLYAWLSVHSVGRRGLQLKF